MKDAGYWDIEIDDSGDIRTTEGLESAIYMSVLCEKRADESEIQKPEYRRGDWSNELNEVEGYEVGSKFWLLEKARNTQEAINKGLQYIKDGLEWMIEDGLIDSVGVDFSEKTNRSVQFEITVYKANNESETYYFDAFINTGE
jgi:phage gp46-like protein